MESPSTPTSSGGPLSEPLLRELTSWALLAIAAVTTVWNVIAAVTGPPTAVLTGAWVLTQVSTGVIVLAGPLLAVLMAVRFGPVLPRGRVIAVVALAQYVMVLAVGTLALLLSFGARFGPATGTPPGVNWVVVAVGGTVIDLLRLVLLALALLWTYTVFTGAGGWLPRRTRTEDA